MKYQVSTSDSGLVFLNDKGKALAGDFTFIHPLQNDEALKVLKQDVKTVGARTAAALGFILQILNSPRMDSYKGQGNINADASLGKDVKNGMREAEAAFFRPMFPDDKAGQKAYDVFIGGIRDAGIYATCKGVALKYFYFAGKLPCAYEGENHNPEKLLSVPAMQKLLQNMVDDKPKPDESIAARLGDLMSEFLEGEFTKDQMVIIQARLGVFAQEVKEAINSLDAQATEHAAIYAAAQEQETVEI